MSDHKAFVLSELRLCVYVCVCENVNVLTFQAYRALAADDRCCLPVYSLGGRRPERSFLDALIKQNQGFGARETSSVPFSV